MKHPLHVLALATALALTPSCAQLKLTLENPLSAAHTTNQRAYALIETYGALIEEATIIVRDPAVPIAAKRSLGAAERVATPAAETLETAITAYDRAEADIRAATNADSSTLARLTATLTAATQRLSQALTAAEGPIGQLETLVHAAHS